MDLSAFTGQCVRIIFRVTTDRGLASTVDGHEIAIDDVAVFDSFPATGQDEQPGFASFKIGPTFNGNFEPLGAGLCGPYFSNVQAEEPMLMEFSGEPNQAVMLLGGVLNPSAATFPAIG